MANLEFILNILIVALLIPTIIYAYKLNKSLNILRANQNSLAKLVNSLNEATFKAENSIPKLKSVTENSSQGLKEVVDSAKTLKDDLLFINQRADTLADRLEGMIHDGRAIKKDDVKAPVAGKPEENAENSQAMAELELLKALRSIK